MKVQGILTADNLLINPNVETADNDTGLPNAEELGYDSESSESPGCVTSKCLACRKKVWKPEWENLPDAEQRKKRGCTWNY